MGFCGGSTAPSVRRVLRRARPGPLPGERVRVLLPRRAGGWVPEPESGDAAHAAGPGEFGAAGADTVRTGPAHAGVDAGPPESVVGRWAALLPVAVRTGRLDPGRRGALALVLAALLAAVVAGGVVWRGRPQEVAVPAVVSSGAPLPGVSADPTPGADGQLVVSVAGKVRRPGVVRLPPGSRVDDAVRAAGGPLPGATIGLLNQARRLVDGEQVLVGVDPPPGVPAAGGPGGGSTGGRLDLNTATASELDALPGIGPVLAQRIVDWRTEHERFASVDQLREVSGIG
ncbi:MAG: ComEA family DNA-binding protein, partial [Frankiales bacterium]|nr:ComEA family DNA-binding protein [Frankiales bacterium]